MQFGGLPTTVRSMSREDLLAFATEFCNCADGSTQGGGEPFERSFLHQTFAPCEAPLLAGLPPTMQNLPL